MPSLSLKLRVAGGFIVLVAGSCGVLLPLVARSTHEAHASPRMLLVKAFSAGIILALALEHLISDSFSNFSQLPPGAARRAPRAACPSTSPGGCLLTPASPARAGTLFNDFSIAPVFVMLGIYIMFLTERLSLDAMAAVEEAFCEETEEEGTPKAEAETSHAHGPAGATEAGAGAGDLEAPPPHPQPEPHSHEHLSAITAARSIISVHAGHSHGSSASPTHAHGSSASQPAEEAPARPPSPLPRSPSPPLASPRNSPLKHGHSHSNVGGIAHGHGHAHAHGALVLSLENLAPPRQRSLEGGVDAAAGGLPQLSAKEAREAANAARRRVLTAHLLELSIVIHSVVIGLNLGTTTAEPGPQGQPDGGSVRPVVALIVVLSFHQFFEGLALGSYVADLGKGVSLRSKSVMVCLFSLAVPAGTWSGIGVASSYAQGSTTALWVKGSLSGLTGGMLLFSALITFMAEEFSRDDVSGAAGRRLKRQMYVSMMLGASLMALLGIWA